MQLTLTIVEVREEREFWRTFQYLENETNVQKVKSFCLYQIFMIQKLESLTSA